jgi:hypothetical protein
MSACMRSLYSSDQWAPGLSFAFLSGRGTDGGLLAGVGLRAPAFSLSVGREGFGLFMRVGVDGGCDASVSSIFPTEALRFGNEF